MQWIVQFNLKKSFLSVIQLLHWSSKSWPIYWKRLMKSSRHIVIRIQWRHPYLSAFFLQWQYYRFPWQCLCFIWESRSGSNLGKSTLFWSNKMKSNPWRHSSGEPWPTEVVAVSRSAFLKLWVPTLTSSWWHIFIINFKNTLTLFHHKIN